jgi:putative membrane protein
MEAACAPGIASAVDSRAARENRVITRKLAAGATKKEGNNMEWIKPGVLLGSIVFALAGVLIFWISFVVIDKITPYNLWEEIVEKQNQALALVVAAMSLGICIIVAAAIH